ncbi:unnamed protein product [Clonostachys solani]|uniref:MYND-type domain-containing protein n=1 Tax=Clonostachys solani TaxID=160281 RepID=A0A9N9ZM67_9HYPO|nr:unnamed protein product [Clonostachys solani]
MTPACVTCKKTAPEVTIKRCAQCSSTPYCSRECQKADWKNHRKVCGKESAGCSSSSSPSELGSQASPLKGLEKSVTKPFTRIGNGTWLHDRPETDVYRLLIDAYRLRVEDEYKMEGKIDNDSLYAGSGSGLKGFRRFLDCVASHAGLLPSWWHAEKRACCERLGMDPSQWQNLCCAVEKSDIIEHYGMPYFHMELRMFAEKVLGSGIGGQDGTMVLQMMASREVDDRGNGQNPGKFAAMVDLKTMKTSIL